jgi:hypothetical protein
MKFSKLAILATISLASISVQAGVTALVEYDYNRVARAGESHYGAAGLIYSPKDSAYFVDGYVQGVTAYVGPRDNLVGYEFGAGVKFPVMGKVTGSARLALGTMGNINFGTGRANYALISAEANYPVTEKVALYAGVSHSSGLNSTAIPASNRVQAGVDYQLTDKVWGRFGLSTTRQINQWLNGFVVTLSREF